MTKINREKTQVTDKVQKLIRGAESILAFDTTGKSLSLAILRGDRLVTLKTLNTGLQHSSKLLPAIESSLAETNTKLEDLDALAVTRGPGSFTGIRIGIATANSLAFSLNIPVIAVSSLETLAANYLQVDSLVLPAFDARGGRLFAGLFRNGLRLLEDRQFIDRELVESLVDKGYQEEKIILLGDGAPIAKELLEGAGFKHLQKVEEGDPANFLSAAALAYLARKVLLADPCLLGSAYKDPAQAEYCALSQAERMHKVAGKA